MTKNELDLLVKGLPKYPGILNKQKYWNSAVLIPLIWLEGEYHLLFQIRGKTIRQGGEICFPGGKIEKGETELEAVVRETVEEIGVLPSQIHILGRMDTLVATFGTTVDIFIGILEVENVDQLVHNDREVERLFTIPVSFFVGQAPETYHIRIEVQTSFTDYEGKEQVLLPAQELGLPEKYHKPWGHSQLPVYVYKTDHGVLWGMTAEIVKMFAGEIRVLR